MRKIEEKMISAIRLLLDRDNNGTSWSHGNTIVTLEPSSGYMVAVVRLHGHAIAQVNSALGVYRVNLCGWNTSTTRSRLSAIVRAFSRMPTYHYDCGLGVSTKQGQVRIHDARGITPIDSDNWHNVQL